jgi:hypothetical protein
MRRILIVCLLLLTKLLAFGQTDDTVSVYYKSSTLNHIVRINSTEAVVYHASITYSTRKSITAPKRISILDEHKLVNALHDSTSREQIRLFYTGEKFVVEKKEEGFVLKQLSGKGIPLMTLRLIPFDDRQKIEESINDYHRIYFEPVKLDEICDEFEDYAGYWQSDSIQAKLDLISVRLPPDQYEAELKLFETVLCDSLRGLNEKYAGFLRRLETESPKVSEVMEIYRDIYKKDYDFEFYGIRLIQQLADYQPQLFFQVAEQFEAPKERRGYFQTLNSRRMRKMNKVEADADIKSDFHKARRHRVIANIVLYTVEFFVILAGAFLLTL